MQYHLIITPHELTQAITAESERIVKEVYGKNISGVYYKIQTTQHQDNPRKTFIKGKGEIFEFVVRPHITLIQNLDISEEKISCFIKDIKKAFKGQTSFILNQRGIGDYNQDFTFYIEFKQNPALTALFRKVLVVAKSYLSEKKLKKHKQLSYIPHTTLLYDDSDPIKVITAKTMMNRDLFNTPVKIKTVELCILANNKLSTIHTFRLL